MAKLKTKDLAAAIRESKGNVARAARALGCSRQAILYHVKRSAQLREMLDDYREGRVDEAESRLDDALESGESWAVMFTLKTLGRKRGYVEKTEHEHSGKDGTPPIRLVEELIVTTREQADAAIA